MKLSLRLLLLCAAAAAAPSLAYVHPSTARAGLGVHHVHRHRHQPPRPRGDTRLFYKEPSPKSDSSSSPDDSSSAVNVWAVLANTERWISDTLDKSNRAANARRDAELERRKKDKPLHFADEKEEGGSSLPPPGDNPYARKEVSYVCETGDELSAVVGGIFRRVREARELGEAHGKGVEARLGEYLLSLCFDAALECYP